MSFRLIEAEKAQHTVSRLCTVLGVTRAGYYAWRDRGCSARELSDRELERLIRRIFDESLQTYGAPRIQAELADEHGVRVGRKRVARLMRRLGIEGVSRRGKKRRTTIADPKAPAAPDLVERKFVAERPNALWLADITYIPTHEGWLFLAAVVDCFSRHVVGWSMRDDLRSELVVDALSMAVARRRPKAGVIHHSDRGSQYTSLAFGKTLRESGLVASMGSRGDAYDNALAESFISTIKCELIKRRTWKSRDQARLAVFQYIETFYNPRRRHSALGYRSPVDHEVEYEKMNKETEERDTNEAAIAA
jgi:putative transposase